MTLTKKAENSRERGFALLVVILIVAVLAAMVGEFLYGVRLQAEMLANHRYGMKARYIGKSAVNSYKYLLETNLLEPGTSQNLLFLSEWAGYGGGLEQMEGGEVASGMLGFGESPLDSNPEGLLKGEWYLPLPSNLFDVSGTMYGKLVNERGKLNLNAMVNVNKGDRTQDTKDYQQYNRLLTLFRLLEIEEQDAHTCLDGIVDWVDGNLSTEPSGAEEDYYRTLDENPYYPRNNLLPSIDEVGLVKGCTLEIVQKIRPFVTVYPRKGVYGQGVPDDRIYPTVASDIVLKAVFLAPSAESGTGVNTLPAVEEVIKDIHTEAARHAGVSVSIDKDGNVSGSGPSMLTTAQVKQIMGERVQGEFNFYQYQKQDAHFYRITGMGEVKGVRTETKAVVMKTMKDVQVLNWRVE